MFPLFIGSRSELRTLNTENFQYHADDPDPPRRFEFKLRWYRTAKFLALLGILEFCISSPLVNYGWPLEFLIGTGFLLLLAASIAIGIGLSQNWPQV